MSETAKYLPPHKRVGTTARDNKEENRIPYNRRIDFSKTSKFNVKSEIMICERVDKSIEKETINIPETIEPPGLIETTEDSNHNETKLFRDLKQIRIENTRREAQKEFDEWIEHYDDDLRRMYDECVGEGYWSSKNKGIGKLGLTYNNFVRLAYECTETTYNRNKFKYTRPLL